MHDPNQPRIPEGHRGGGRWTRTGHGLLSDVGKQLQLPKSAENSPLEPNPWHPYQDLYLTSDLDRMRPEPGEQHALAGGYRQDRSKVGRLAKLFGLALAAGIAMFEKWSRQSRPDQRTIASFRAREFDGDDAGFLVPEQVRTLDRVIVANDYCRNLPKIEDLLDDVLKRTPRRPGETNAAYGSRIHKVLEREIKTKYPSMKAEVSVTSDNPEAKYGEDGSIRVDVLEEFDDGTVCIYDFKTGGAVLGSRRMLDIAKMKFDAERAARERRNDRGPLKVRRIIVVQVKPGQKRWSDSDR